MTNQEIAQILREIGEYLEMENVAFKPRAYEKVAEEISSLQEEVSGIYSRDGLNGLKEIPGIGQSIAEHIEELIKTGHLKYYEKLKKEAPVDLATLTKVEGLGPRKIKVLYEKLKIRNLKDLERAAKAHKIAKLAGFGEKSEENILKGIEFVKSSGGRFILGYAMPEIRAIENKLRALEEVEILDIAGSIRRRKETVADIDILVASKKPEPIMDFFVNMPEVARVYAHGPTKSMVHLKNGMDADIRVVSKESYGAALNYFTGSKDHNVALRELAIKKNLKLNEYGLFQILRNGKEGKVVAGKTEEEIYKALGLDYIEPEMREMTGEMAVALRPASPAKRGEQAHGKPSGLPKLIGYGDLKGDLQTQTTWTDGANTIEQMAEEAIKIGLEYIAITDHTKRLAMTHGLDEKRILKQVAEIDKLNSHFSSRDSHLSSPTPHFRILKGTECDILKDGSLDLPDEILRKLDMVGISVHSYFKLPRHEQTKRVIRAMENPHADMLFHPTCRKIQGRDPIDIDMEEIIKVAKRTGTILEIDSYPDRLDLKDEYIKKCVKAGVKMAIDSDAHAANQFSVLEYGIAQARRGWATKADVINTRPVEEMLKLLK